MAPFIPMAYLFNRAELPPGHDELETLPPRDMSCGLRGIFVGGILPPVYDISELFSGKLPLELTICCREDEWTSIKSFYKKPPASLSIIHKSGSELKKEYLKHHIFVMIRNDHLYLRMNQPIKLYEAIGFELPILISPGSLASEIVEELNIGWVTSDIEYHVSRSEYLEKYHNIRKIKSSLTWDNRVNHLIELLKKNKLIKS